MDGPRDPVLQSGCFPMAVVLQSGCLPVFALQSGCLPACQEIVFARCSGKAVLDLYVICTCIRTALSMVYTPVGTKAPKPPDMTWPNCRPGGPADRLDGPELKAPRFA